MCTIPRWLDQLDKMLRVSNNTRGLDRYSYSEAGERLR